MDQSLMRLNESISLLERQMEEGRKAIEQVLHAEITSRYTITIVWVLRCFDTVFWDHASLFESALRQSSPRQMNVNFAKLVGFGLNFSVVYIL